MQVSVPEQFMIPYYRNLRQRQGKSSVTKVHTLILGTSATMITIIARCKTGLLACGSSDSSSDITGCGEMITLT
jgi:hypothetical protein